ncbi:MAG: hypothetical protein WKF43_03055 [Acidimicrobiales bacterium]
MTTRVSRRIAAGTAVLLLAGVLAVVEPAGGQDAGALAGSIVVPVKHADRCDPIGGPRCMLPFPNDFFTIADSRTDTGRRVNLHRRSTPANRDGVHIDPTEQNRNDGFSPGSALVALIPGLDVRSGWLRRGPAPITDMAQSLQRDAPIVLVDADTGKRHPYWAELDANATSDENRLLFVRPAVNFREGHRYVIGLRKLKNAANQPIPPSDAFRAYRDSLDTHDPLLERRRPAMERIFRDLGRAGVERGGLTLAWDFTVASERNLSERLLHMRDDAFEALGRSAPAFHVDSVEEAGPGTVLRTVRGTFEAPRYLTGTGLPGSVLNNGTRGDVLPQRNGTQTANFVCVVPRSALLPSGGANPSRMSLYGHGLLGDADQVGGAASRYASASNTTFCATDWIGMASEDVLNAVTILQDLSRFRSLADRLQQGILNFLFLGRLMKHADGLSSDPAFQDASGAALLDQRHLAFVGVSQGGILGGAATAVAQDWKRAYLGVPAMNYSTLLNRSIDFDIYGAILNPRYPDPADRQLGLLLVQMLWDRGENNGYAQHLTSDPYRNTKAKQVFLFEAFGDHQVANVATEVMARTIGARLRVPGLALGRSPDVEPFWDIRPVGRLPSQGQSYLVVWDFGAPAPPTANVPPREGEDPHGKGRDDPDVLRMTAEFLDHGRLVDVCGGAPCQTLDP